MVSVVKCHKPRGVRSLANPAIVPRGKRCGIRPRVKIIGRISILEIPVTGKDIKVLR